jgi:hypothetical protein
MGMDALGLDISEHSSGAALVVFSYGGSWLALPGGSVRSEYLPTASRGDLAVAKAIWQSLSPNGRKAAVGLQLRQHSRTDVEQRADQGQTLLRNALLDPGEGQQILERQLD